MMLGCTGGEVTVTANVLEAEAPQLLFAVAVTFPLVADRVVVSVLVEEVPVHPDGVVQVYDVAPVTGAMLYVWLMPLHTLALPAMAPGTAGIPIGVTASVCVIPEPQAFTAVTVTFPLADVVVADSRAVVDEPVHPTGIVQT